VRPVASTVTEIAVNNHVCSDTFAFGTLPRPCYLQGFR